MAGDISVKLRADPGEFNSGVADARNAVEKFVTATESGADTASDAFADVIRELVKLGTQSGRTRSEMVSDLKKLGLTAEDAEDAIDAIADETKTLGRDGSRDLGRAEDALDDVGDSAEDAADKTEGINDATDSVGDGVRDLGDIAKDALEGDFSSAAEGAVQALAGIAGKLGGVAGAALGAAGALGIGAIISALGESEEAQKRVNEAAADWAQVYLDSSGQIISEASKVAEVNAIATDSDRYKEASENAKNWGVDVSTAMLAMAGDATALDTVQESLNQKQREWNAILEETSTASAKSYDKSTLTAQQRELGAEVANGTNAFKEQAEAMALGRQQADNAAASLYTLATAGGKATGEVDDLGNAIYTLDDKTVVVNAETKKAYIDVDAFEKQKVSDKTTTIKVGVDDSAWKKWRPTIKQGIVQTTKAKGISWQ